LRDDAVEGRASISEALLAGAKSTEVLSGLWDYIIVEVEVDAALLLCRRRLLAVWRCEVNVGRRCQQAQRKSSIEMVDLWVCQMGIHAMIGDNTEGFDDERGPCEGERR